MDNPFVTYHYLLFKVFIYEYNEASRRWIRVEAVSTVTEAVHDIAFAPNIGRSYHVLVSFSV